MTTGTGSGNGHSPASDRLAVNAVKVIDDQVPALVAVGRLLKIRVAVAADLDHVQWMRFRVAVVRLEDVVLTVTGRAVGREGIVPRQGDRVRALGEIGDRLAMA